jgi:hypothetical protein
MLGPVVGWFLGYPEFRRFAGWPAEPSLPERVLLDATVPLLVIAAAWWIVKEAVAWRRTGRVNVPKTLLLVAYVPLHLALLLGATASGAYDLLLFQAAVTLPHNLQYMAIVWVHNRARYHGGGAPQRFGWAAAANASPARFVLLGVAFSVVFFYSRFWLEGQPAPFVPGRYAGADAPIGGMFRFSDLVAATWIGVVFHHQWLDQKIWKVSRDHRLASDLGLETPPAAPRAA